jgi:preprotein translocase subunit SecA
MVKVREGVNLRSFEQRSPLNIYVEEADKHFNEMKRNVAHAAIIQINHIFVPKVNEAIFNELSSVLDTLNIDKKIYEDLKNRNNDQIIQNAFNNKPNFTLNLKPASPKDKFTPAKQEKRDDATTTLMKIAESMKRQHDQAAKEKEKVKTVAAAKKPEEK